MWAPDDPARTGGGMAQSPEYPDLKWVPPRAWGRGRDGKAVRFIVIHYTAGSERATSAEDGAAYDARRTDGTSTHYFVDSNSVVQCVRTADRANTARSKGNRLGIQYELCGTVQTRAQWLDAASLPTLRNAARQAARDCVKYDIPVRRLSVAQTRQAWTGYPSGPKGFVGHVDCTYAFPEDGGDHTDPGTAFPWDVFLQMVRDEIEGDELNADDRKFITEQNAKIVTAVNDARSRIVQAIEALPDEVLTAKVGDPTHPPREVRNVLVDLAALRGMLIGADEADPDAIEVDAPVRRMIAAADSVLGRNAQ